MGWSSDLDQNSEDKIRELLIGHKITRVADDKLTLDDGTILTIYPNEGCGGCSAGWYGITALNDCDNIITNVSLEEEKKEGEWDYGWVYNIFVYAENTAINLLTVEGDDGNGYYGTGYTISITKPGEN